MSGLAALSRSEFTLLRRDVASMILPFALPLGLLVGFGSGSGDMHQAVPELGGMTPFELFIVPIALVIVLPMMSLTVFPVTLSSYRERGVLRRLATTPVRPLTLLAAQLLVHVGLLVASLGLTGVVAGAVFDVSAPRQPVVAAGALFGGMVALYGMGVTIAALAPKASTATAYGMGLFFPQLLLGGLMVPADQLPAVLARIGEFTPVGATLHGLQAAWIGEDFDDTTHGEGPADAGDRGQAAGGERAENDDPTSGHPRGHVDSSEQKVRRDPLLHAARDWALHPGDASAGE